MGGERADSRNDLCGINKEQAVFQKTISSKLLWFIGIFLAFVILPVSALADPFKVSASLSQLPDKQTILTVSFDVPIGHYLYADQIEVQAEPPVSIIPYEIPKPKKEFDTFSGEEKEKYTHDVELAYKVSGMQGDSFHLTVHYQGCNASICFLPAKKALQVSLAAVAGEEIKKEPLPSPSDEEPKTARPSGETEWLPLADEFEISGKTFGYVGSERFMNFLQDARAGKASQTDFISTLFAEKSLWLALAMILLGGLALNLTPCVLPLIPINLMIIGAGNRSASRMQGLARGGIYGLGMALAYGSLGLISALTGTTFGALNSSPGFNIAIAILFIILALGMLGVIPIDFSRMQSKISPALIKRGGYLAAFLMGIVAALLAGACVAPVVISVLVLSGSLYASGNSLALLLPFLLGLGMALPWPFAGAGLGVLPKPGKWMVATKYIFGLFILLLALYYAYEGIRLFQSRMINGESFEVIDAQQKQIDEAGWHTNLREALRESQQTGKPLFIDFWASWCKNCLTMDRTTFRDAKVQRELNEFVKLKYQAEEPDKSPAREILEYFEVHGLPTYVVMKQKLQGTGNRE